MSFRSRVLSIAALLACVLYPAEAQDASGKRYAIVIGINAYSNRSLNNLSFAERDAIELAKELKLEKNGYEVRLLLGSSAGDDQATRKNILQALDAVLGKVAGKRDLVLMAVAGHGVQVPIKGSDGKERETPFFCPFDARADATDPDGRRMDPATLLDLNEVIRRLNVNGGKHNLLLVDACRDNPNLPRGGRGVDGSVVENLASGTAVLFSCSQGLRAFETEKAGGGHGIFFHLVIEGLQGKAADDKGVVNWSRLSEYVQANVDDRVRDWVGANYSQGPHEVKNLVGRPPLLTGVRSFSGRRAGEERTNEIGMKFCWCPAETFTTGGSSRKDARQIQKDNQIEVTLSRGFWIGKYEVTQGEYSALTGFEPSFFRRMGKGAARVADLETKPFPVENVSWLDAVRFCNLMSAQELLRPYYKLSGSSQNVRIEREPGADGYRLPTAAEVGALQSAVAPDDEHCWSQANSERRPHEVGTRTRSLGGVYDLYGNVAEWCDDERHDNHAPEAQVRGGSWADDPAEILRKEGRWVARTFTSPTIGFRVVRNAAR